MEIIPLLHVHDGHIISGGPGKWKPVPTPYADGGSDVVGYARHLFARFERLAVTDFGTGVSGDADHTLYQKLAKQQVTVWADGMSETLEDVLDLFISGADRVTVRMDRFELDDLAEVLDMAEGEVWLGYPYKNLEELKILLRDVDPYEYVDAGAAGLVLINQTPSGVSSGAPTEALSLVRYKDVRVHLAGGVTNIAQLDAIKEAGGSGVLVGAPLFADIAAWAAAAKTEREAEEAANPAPAEAPATAPARVPGPISPLPGVLPGDAPGPRDEAKRGA